MNGSLRLSFRIDTHFQHGFVFMNSPHASSEFFRAPVWLVGFRPFFTLAFIAGALLPLLWASWNTGLWRLHSGLMPTQWHAHEMLFGFGWAVLGGFLLTASKNWVSIRGMHGAVLFVAAVLWLVERFVVACFPAPDAPFFLRLGAYLLSSAFILYVGSYLMWTLIRFRHQDSFKDNYFFMIALPAFLVAKFLLLTHDTWTEGYWMAIGLFRVAFVVMFERTMTQFMKNAQGVQLLRNAKLDFAIKGLVLLSAFEAFLPPLPSAVIVLAAASVLFIRFCCWKPLLGLKRFDTATMYVGYFGLTLHLLLEGLRLSGVWNGFGTSSIHVFTFLCMGVVIPAMLVRIAQGHTGRKILFTTGDKMAISLMLVAAFFRVVAPWLWPQHYLLWIWCAATGWSLCFVLVGLRLTPFLWQARIDGREH